MSISMAEDDPELTGLDFVAETLEPIKLVVWGDLALDYLGVPLSGDFYMLGVRDDEMELAAQKLANAGFVRHNWSLGFLEDPALHSSQHKRLQEYTEASYANIDAKSIRFNYPDMSKYVEKTVLLPASYIRLDIPRLLSDSVNNKHATPGLTSQPPFYIHFNLHYPNAVMLLQSIIKVLLEELDCTPNGNWRATLQTWAFGYLYHRLSLRDNLLDDCGDEKVIQYWNTEIRRGQGIPRGTEKWGKPQKPITNDLIKDFQIEEDKFYFYKAASSVES